MIDNLTVSNNESMGSGLEESNAYQESIDPGSAALSKRDELFNKLIKVYRPIAGLNPNVFHTNVVKMTNKFTDSLKQTTEINLLKFLPSQYLFIVANVHRTKVMYQYNFRDQSREDDYTDLSQSLAFLEFLTYQIRRYNLKMAKSTKSRTYEEGTKHVIKSTHSATKSRMNQQIDSAENEDRKELEEDIQYLELVKENADTFEVIMPGYLLRLTKIPGVAKMSNNDKYFSVLIFQRYIRRRRKYNKNKDPTPTEKYYNFGNGIVPTLNLKERELVARSFTTFVRNNLIVSSTALYKATKGSSQRKKIIKLAKKGKNDLDSDMANVLIQSYAQGKELKSCRNDNKNTLKSNRMHIQVAKSPFDYDPPIGPGDINIKLGNKIGQMQGESSNSMESIDTIHMRDEFHYNSEFTSLLEESLSPDIHDRRGHIKDVNEINRDELNEMSEFFEDDSSICLTHESINSDTSIRASHRRHAQVRKKTPKTEKKPRKLNESDTKFSHFFDSKFSNISEAMYEDSEKDDNSLKKLKKIKQSKSGTDESYKTANEAKSSDSDSEEDEEDSDDSDEDTPSDSSQQSPVVDSDKK